MEKGRYYNWMLTKWWGTFDKKKKEWIQKADDIIHEYNYSTIEYPDTKMVFMCYSLEIAPTTGLIHSHVYCEFSEKVSMKWIKENFNDNTLHCEPRKGTQKEAIEYATKLETRVEGVEPTFWGIKKSQGNRSELDSLVDAIESGMTGREILMQFRGTALRNINMIYRGLSSFHKMESIDMAINLLEKGDKDGNNE